MELIFHEDHFSASIPCGHGRNLPRRGYFEIPRSITGKKAWTGTEKGECGFPDLDDAPLKAGKGLIQAMRFIFLGPSMVIKAGVRRYMHPGF
jgi:hypothetical protein